MMTQRKAYLDAVPMSRNWKPETVDSKATTLERSGKVQEGLRELREKAREIEEEQAEAACLTRVRKRQIPTAIAEGALNEGIYWAFPTYEADGHFIIRTFPGYEICPEWADAEHEVLEYAYRVYPVKLYQGKFIERTIWKVEVYTESGIDFFESDGYSMNIVPCEPWHQDYMLITDEDGHQEGYNWSRIPLIPFRANRYETPLIKSAKSLQDAINTILSNFTDNMQEDARNTILVLVNYDGENLGSFRQNLSTYGAVKVTSVDGVQGDVKTLQVSVNADNYKAIPSVLRMRRPPTRKKTGRKTTPKARRAMPERCKA